MSEIILDGTGGGWKAQVDENNSLHVFAITETEQQQATQIGNSYNINTGDITISGSSAVLYFKNDENADFVVDAFAVGFSSGSNGAIPKITLVRNPTGGTCISNAVAVDQNQNRNFGSSKTLKTTTLAYKGNSGNTFTGGDNIAQFYQGLNGRIFASIDFEIPRGSALGVEINPELTAGSVKLYAALIGYTKYEKNE